MLVGMPGSSGGGRKTDEYLSNASWTVWSEMAVWRCTRRTSSVSGSARRNADIFSLSCSHNWCSDSRDCSLFARVVVVVVIMVVMVVPLEDLLSIISGTGKVRGKI